MSATYISNITIRFQSVDEHKAGDLGISHRSLRRESPLGAGWCYVPATKDSGIHPHRQPSRQPQGRSGRHGRPHPFAPSRPGDDRGEGTLTGRYRYSTPAGLKIEQVQAGNWISSPADRSRCGMAEYLCSSTYPCLVQVASDNLSISFCKSGMEM